MLLLFAVADVVLLLLVVSDASTESMSLTHTATDTGSANATVIKGNLSPLSVSTISNSIVGYR